MKKVMISCCILALLLTGCGNGNVESKSESKTETIVSMEASVEQEDSDEQETTGVAESMEASAPSNASDIAPAIPPVSVDPARPATWADGLNALGEIKVDADGDGTEDTISIVYADKEGSLYLSKLEFTLSTDNHYVLSEEEAIYRNRFGSLKQIEVVDINQDGKKELVCLLDAHSGGGRGMCEILVLWMDQSEITATLLGVEEPQIQGVDQEALFANSETEVDGIYFCQKVLYEGKEYLLTRQYAWSGSHSGHVGDLVCITALDKDEKALDVEVAWIEPESYFPW